MKFIYYLKKNNKLFFNICIYLFIFFLLTNSKIVIASIKESLNIFLTNILPALFPYLLLTELLINSGKISSLSFGLETILSKLFHIPKNSTPAVIIGFFLGYPNSAKYILKLYNEHIITSKTANILTSFTSNANMSYIISAVGIGIFNSIEVGIILIISHFLSSIIIGIFLTSSYNNTIIQQNMTISNSLYKISSGFELLSTSVLRNTKNPKLYIFVYYYFLPYTRYYS